MNTTTTKLTSRRRGEVLLQIIKSDPAFKKQFNRFCWLQLGLIAMCIAPAFIPLPAIVWVPWLFVVASMIIYVGIRLSSFKNQRISLYLEHEKGS
jgi:hypothetical protein